MPNFCFTSFLMVSQRLTNLLTRSTATIHKYQCLLVMHTGTCQALALPSALRLIIHPAGIFSCSSSMV